jgi:hypothetical protein
MTVRELIAALEVVPDQDVQVVVDVLTRRWMLWARVIERVTVVPDDETVVLWVDAR